MNFFLLLMVVLVTAVFIDYKISRIARVIAFQESEKEKESIISFIMLVICSIFWTIYFYNIN